MRPLPIRYVRDLPAVQRFYAALGLQVGFSGRAPRDGGSRWVEMVGSDGGMLALHASEGADAPVVGQDDEGAADPEHADHPRGEPAVELAFEADDALEDVVARLRAAGYEPHTAIIDESYGRSFTARDPEGLRVQINEHDRALHG